MSLDPLICPCSTMFRIDAPHLCWVLENLVEGRVVNRIVVDDDTAEWARVALDRMLVDHLSRAGPGRAGRTGTVRGTHQRTRPSAKFVKVP